MLVTETMFIINRNLSDQLTSLNNKTDQKENAIAPVALPLLNGAYGTLNCYRMSANLYLVAGYVNTHNTWFCNFPVAPAGIYAGREARITGVTDAGTVLPICINAKSSLISFSVASE